MTFVSIFREKTPVNKRVFFNSFSVKPHLCVGWAHESPRYQRLHRSAMIQMSRWFQEREYGGYITQPFVHIGSSHASVKLATRVGRSQYSRLRLSFPFGSICSYYVCQPISFGEHKTHILRTDRWQVPCSITPVIVPSTTSLRPGTPRVCEF